MADTGGAAAEQGDTEQPATTATGRRVVLLHGLWMPRLSMHWHARQLRRAGFNPVLVGYAGIAGGPEAAISRLRATLHEPCDILAHSLGGLIAVRALERDPALPVRRVVCLGSPLCGSAAARGMGRFGLGSASLGRSADLLRDGCGPWQGPAQLGVVAGNLGLGFGRVFGRFPGGNDGTVAVDETRLAGESDHIVLPTSHSGMLLSPEVSAQAIHFLAHGRFEH
ncbi:alpha/beta hydrolase [Lysobacter sp. A289]